MNDITQHWRMQRILSQAAAYEILEEMVEAARPKVRNVEFELYDIVQRWCNSKPARS
jgi:hypothetical protein